MKIGAAYLVFLAISFQTLSAQVSKDAILYREILEMDSLLFQEAFNKCNTGILNKIVAPDLEFYHDQSGKINGREKFVTGIKNNICGISYKPYRKLIEGESEVHKLYESGEIYAVLQKGFHEFYAIEEGKDPYLTSSASFSHLWVKTDSTWLLKEVLSYDHRSPEDLSPPAEETGLCSEASSIKKLLEKHKVPALGLAVLEDKRIQKLAVYGELEKGRAAPVDALFNVASLTKPIVSMLTLKLVDDESWNLDAPLHTYYTDPDVADDPRSEQLTTRHILSHQSGFPNWRWENESGKLEFRYEPGKSFGYSGEGFEYLKKALEAKFKTNLESLADSLLFTPLKMSDTQFYWTETTDEEKFAKWHDQEGVNSYKTIKDSSASAADDLLTTVEDYARFAEFVLNGAGLSEDLHTQMTKRQNGVENSMVMGLGWEILPGLKNDEYALLHTGGDQGVNSLIILLPKTGEGLVVFTNGDNGKKLFFDLTEAYLSLGKQIVEKA